MHIVVIRAGYLTNPDNLRDTSNIAEGKYTLRGYILPVPGETTTKDNSLYASVEICVTISCDVDGDRDVDIYDIVMMAGPMAHNNAIRNT